MLPLYIIKIGGNVIDNQSTLSQFFQNFASLSGHCILIHGGGALASKLSKELGIIPTMVEGRRITDADTLRIVTMVYAGLVNKSLVAGLQAQNCPAIGLCGADASLITAHQRKIEELDYGFVGDIDHVRGDILQQLLHLNLVPVIAPITHNAKGQLLNTNADTIAASIAMALAAMYQVHLLYCFEKPGVLRSVDDESSLISTLSFSEYQNLRYSGVIHTGMLPKLDNAFATLQAGVHSVYICHVSALPDILQSQGTQTGTRLYL